MQIWTRRAFLATIPTAETDSASGDSSARIQAAVSSANEMQVPGSFPYGVTISLDRESGPDGDEGKGVFCWALDGAGRITGDGARFSERDVGGEVQVERRDEESSCGCRWES